MGPKITIDSSTLMNKGLEVIEAHELFGVGYDEIEVVVHPQSIIHSMVEFCDGATIAQLSNPDMRLPIGYALAYPDRFGQPYGAIDWLALRQLDFDAPDMKAFRCLALAYAAGREGGDTPAWLNAANEVAVDAFLRGRIAWLSIPEVVERTLEEHTRGELCLGRGRARRGRIGEARGQRGGRGTRQGGVSTTSTVDLSRPTPWSNRPSNKAALFRLLAVILLIVALVRY